jgi:acyl dehydratase
VKALPEVGEALPELVVPITPTRIVAGAIASRDYQDVHHDVTAARAKGSPDIFMNILTTNGYVGRYVTDWAGPEARILKIAIRLGVPNYPGDTMTLTGSVIRTEEDGTVEVAVRGANRLGDHVTGTVTVLPAPCRA